MMPAPVFRAVGISKAYGPVTVLDCADLSILPGQVHALLGANGAGKSTLSRIIAGLATARSGAMQFLGQPFRPKSKRDAERVGIEIVQQEFNLVATLSVAENLFLRDLPRRFGIIRRGALRKNATKLLESFGMSHLDPDCKVASLGIGQQQMIEVAAAFSRNCQLLILDEPTAALSQQETGLLFDQIARLKSAGKSILYISHRLDEIKTICDWLTILRDGRVVHSAATHLCDKSMIVKLMSGKEPNSQQRPPEISLKPPHSDGRGRNQDAEVCGLRINKLCSGQVRDVSFSVSAGQKFGITGLVGSGRTRLLRAIFGAARIESGSISLASEPGPLRFRCPAEAVSHGIALVTEDRKRQGLLLPHSIEVNTTLTSLSSRFSFVGQIAFGRERSVSKEMCERLQTKCSSTRQPVGTLSGGNQQKVVIAKWLVSNTQVFLFDEPTRGIDVAARRLVHELIDQLAKQGKVIVIVSSEIDELFETCDCIGVMSRGSLVQVQKTEQWTREAITRASFFVDVPVAAWGDSE